MLNRADGQTRNVTAFLRQGHLSFLATQWTRESSTTPLALTLSSPSYYHPRVKLSTRQSAKHSDCPSLLIQQYSLSYHKQRSNLKQRFAEKMV